MLEKAARKTGGKYNNPPVFVKQIFRNPVVPQLRADTELREGRTEEEGNAKSPRGR